MQVPNKVGNNKSKIEACIRSKINIENQERHAQYTLPLDNQGQTALKLNAGARPNYSNQGLGGNKKVRKHPPLKYFIEGKVKLTDMISPGKIEIRKGERRHKSKVEARQQYVDNELQKGSLKPDASSLNSSHFHYTTRIISEGHSPRD